MDLSAVIGRLPLMDVVFIRQAVSIVSVVAFSYLQIVKSDASRQTSQIVKLDALLGEEAEDLFSLWVGVIDDLSPLDSRVVASVGDGS